MDLLAHRPGDWILFLLLAYIACILVWSLRNIFTDRRDMVRDFRNMRSDWRDTKSDLAVLIAAYRRGRQSGLGVEDAMRAASDLIAAYKLGRKRGLGAEDAFAAATDETGGVKRVAPESLAPANNPGRFFGVVYTILVNSVSIIGVYQFHWPIGTGLALYWAENVLTGLVVVGSIALWRAKQPTTGDRGPRATSPGEVLVITAVFNAAHLVFLLAFLGVILVRIDPVERFDRPSFTQGLAFIAILLALDFLLAALRMRETSAAQLQRSVSLYLQRIVVLHLTIIFGMCTLALFGQARAVFAVFAGLKMFVDVTRRL